MMPMLNSSSNDWKLNSQYSVYNHGTFIQLQCPGKMGSNASVPLKTVITTRGSTLFWEGRRDEGGRDEGNKGEVVVHMCNKDGKGKIALWMIEWMATAPVGQLRMRHSYWKCCRLPASLGGEQQGGVNQHPYNQHETETQSKTSNVIYMTCLVTYSSWQHLE